MRAGMRRRCSMLRGLLRSRCGGMGSEHALHGAPGRGRHAPTLPLVGPPQLPLATCVCASGQVVSRDMHQHRQNTQVAAAPPCARRPLRTPPEALHSRPPVPSPRHCCCCCWQSRWPSQAQRVVDACHQLCLVAADGLALGAQPGFEVVHAQGRQLAARGTPLGGGRARGGIPY